MNPIEPDLDKRRNPINAKRGVGDHLISRGVRRTGIATGDDRQVLAKQGGLGEDLSQHEKRKIERMKRNRHRILEIDVQPDPKDINTLTTRSDQRAVREAEHNAARAVMGNMAHWRKMTKLRIERNPHAEISEERREKRNKLLKKRRTKDAWRKRRSHSAKSN